MRESYTDREIDVLEFPVYNLADAASYARVPYQTLRYWTVVSKLIRIASYDPPGLSFFNLLECHLLQALRSIYELKINAVRRAVETLQHLHPESTHPLLESRFSTDKSSLFLGNVNLTTGGQVEIREIIETYLHRIDWSLETAPKFYPFVARDDANEPKIISISPLIAFGRSVIDGTGIATAVIAARFKGRDSIPALAEEYGRQPHEIEEAIRWETNRTPAAP